MHDLDLLMQHYSTTRHFLAIQLLLDLCHLAGPNVFATKTRHLLARQLLLDLCHHAGSNVFATEITHLLARQLPSEDSCSLVDLL